LPIPAALAQQGLGAAEARQTMGPTRLAIARTAPKEPKAAHEIRFPHELLINMSKRA